MPTPRISRRTLLRMLLILLEIRVPCNHYTRFGVMADYSRPSGGWRFELSGLNVKNVADALPYHKCPIAVNVRATSDKSARTRPGYVNLFNTGALLPITDIRAFSDFTASNAPRYLARNTNNQIYLDTGTLVGTLNGAGSGVFMIPFRPGAA